MSILNVNTIADVSGTTAITIDSTGRILTPARPAFHHSSTTVGAQSGDIVFNSEVFDTGGVFDNTVFTAPVAGLYQFNFVGYGASSTNGTISGGHQLDLMKSTDGGSNYSVVLSSYANNSGGYPTLNFTTILELNLNDKIKLNCAAQYIYSHSTGSGKYTRFSGHLIG